MKQLLIITLVGLFTSNISYANTETLSETTIPTLKTEFKEMGNIDNTQNIKIKEEIPNPELDLIKQMKEIEKKTNEIKQTELNPEIDQPQGCKNTTNGKTICATTEKMNVRKDVSYY